MSQRSLHTSLEVAKDLLREYDEDTLVDAPHEKVEWLADQLRDLTEAVETTITAKENRA